MVTINVLALQQMTESPTGNKSFSKDENNMNSKANRKTLFLIRGRSKQNVNFNQISDKHLGLLVRIRKIKATINGESSDIIPGKDSTDNCKINLPITELLIKDDKDNDGELSDQSSNFDNNTAVDVNTTLEAEERR